MITRGYVGDCSECECLVARVRELEALVEQMREALHKLEWYEDVDVNGEYTTTRPRPTSEMRTEVERITALAS